MKRFFHPIKNDDGVAAKKPTLSLNDNEEDNINNNNNKREPTKFVTWNANSFLLRVKNNLKEITKFVQTIDPDVIAIQEVRMPAAGPKGGPKNQGELKDDTSSSREEKQVLIRAMSSPPFKDYKVWWSLSDSKYAGTALFIKKCCQPNRVFFSLDKSASKHEPDGRVILAEFDSFRLLNTYSPNNGWKEEENSFQRRRKWDKRMMEFVSQNSDMPLIWCGDLNVSHEEIDVSHPDFFSAAKLNGYVPPNKEDCGQPGFTLGERKRFGALLKEGKLIDAYRYLHKEKDMERGFSWSGNPVGKYRGKRMRIDYFVVSEKFQQRIVSCEMHGQGIELQGFYGSDHCPVSLELSQASPADSNHTYDEIIESHTCAKLVSALKEGETECPFYMRTGSCKYWSNCRFNHPQPTGVEIEPPSGYVNGGTASLRAAPPTTTSLWSSRNTSNKSGSVSRYLPTNGVPAPNLEWNSYQAPVYPATERRLPNPPALGLNNHAETNFYTHNNKLPMIVNDFPERPGEPECSYFIITGDCKYRSGCKFHH